MPEAMNNSQYSPTTWGADPVSDLRVPSGQLCQVKQLTMEDVVDLDIMDQVDSLGSIVETEHIDRVKKPQDHSAKQPTKAQKAKQEVEEQQRQEEITRELLKDKNKFKAMADAIDKVVERVVLQPSIIRPIDDDGNPLKQREKGVIYMDSVSFADKMAIFDYCFEGVSNMESFREERGEDVGSLADEPEHEQATQ